MDDEANEALFGTETAADQLPLETKPKKKKSKKLNLDDETSELADDLDELDLGGKKKKKNKVDFLAEVDDVSFRKRNIENKLIDFLG